MAQPDEKEKTRRLIGAVMLCMGILCALWGDNADNPAVYQCGKIAAVIGIGIYFSGRIGKLLRKC